jgi:hypothetical protein
MEKKRGKNDHNINEHEKDEEEWLSSLSHHHHMSMLWWMGHTER